jgi:hypothetical protein
MSSNSTADAMYRESLQNELRQTELAVVDGERKLSEQEALVISLKKQNREFQSS